jgi:ATP/maltotriose-dependent transcriptional regulator MalT
VPARPPAPIAPPRPRHAIAERALGRTAAALDYLEVALRLAAPEGYRRAFLDEGPIVAELLPLVRRSAPVFVDELLAAFGRTPLAPSALGERQSSATPALALPEPLSSRELKVLEPIGQGRSNAEIADALVIGVSTAKWHVSNVIGKLGAKSRTQAISRARELGLLP